MISDCNDGGYWSRTLKKYSTSNGPSSGRSVQCMAFFAFVRPNCARIEFGRMCLASSCVRAITNITSTQIGWRRGPWRCRYRVSDLRSRGRGFESRPGTRRQNSGQVSHTYVPLSPSWYRPKGGDALRLGSKGRYGLGVGDEFLFS